MDAFSGDYRREFSAGGRDHYSTHIRGICNRGTAILLAGNEHGADRGDDPCGFVWRSAMRHGVAGSILRSGDDGVVHIHRCGWADGDEPPLVGSGRAESGIYIPFYHRVSRGILATWRRLPLHDGCRGPVFRHGPHGTWKYTGQLDL